MITQLFVQSMGNRVSSGGIGPFIIYPAMIAGVVAVWKYKPNKEGNNDLDKS